MKKEEEEKLINKKIFDFCWLCSNDDLGESNFPTLKQMHVTDIQYDIESNTYTITLCSPGVLIGRQGRTIEALEKTLKAKIDIVEKKFYDSVLL